MNPLKRARFRVGHSLRTARDGTTRTMGWVKDGVVGAPGKARAKLRRGDGDAGSAATAPAPTPPAPTAPTPATSSESTNPFGGAVRAARENPRVAIAWAAVAVLVLAWIGWTVYVWIENGSTAGVGVLVSWPAAIAALALVVSPFVAATFLVRRLSGEGGPQMAGAPGIAGDSGAATTTAPDEKAEKGDDAEKDERDEDEDDEEEDEGETGAEDESDAPETVAEDEGSENEDPEDDAGSGDEYSGDESGGDAEKDEAAG